jgi:hypothetical protein
LGGRKALGVLLETLDAEELLADGLFVVPWCSLRLAPEDAKNRGIQWSLSAPRVRGMRNSGGMDCSGAT